MREAFEHTARNLEDSFAQRGTEITEKLAATGGVIADDISARAVDMRDQIAAAGHRSARN